MPLDWQGVKPPGEAPLLPFEEKPGDHAHSLQTYLGIRAGHDLTRELVWLLVNTEREWQRQRDIGEAQPTPGEMSAIVGDGAKRARELLEWSDSLPAALFHNVTVLIPGDPRLRAAIEHLAHSFELLSEIYPRRRGRPPGRREAAQWVAIPLMLFTYRHAPEATQQQQRVFVRECLHLLRVGIECPDPNDHPTNSVRWFRPVEAAAKRGLALSIARSRARALAQAKLSE